MGIGDLATNSALLSSGFTGKVAKGQTIHLLLKHITPTAGKPDYISGMVMTTGGANLTDREVGLAVNEMGLLGVSPVELLAWEQVRQEIPEDIMSKIQVMI